jgi:hypothetical protein
MIGNRVELFQEKYLLNIVKLGLIPFFRETNQPSIVRAATFKCISFYSYLIRY